MEEHAALVARLRTRAPNPSGHLDVHQPLVDRVICRGTQNSWRLWWEALSAHDDLESLADKVRSHLRQYELSTLRTLDIVLWMWGKENPRA